MKPKFYKPCTLNLVALTSSPVGVGGGGFTVPQAQSTLLKTLQNHNDSNLLLSETIIKSKSILPRGLT